MIQHDWVVEEEMIEDEEHSDTPHSDREMAPDVAGEGTRQPAPLVLPDGPVLVVAAHPDDPDFGCGGSMARLVAEGREVTIALVTDGTEGGEDPDVPDDELRRMREAEQRAAASELGVSEVVFLGFPDGRVEPNLALRHALTRLIRQVRPATVFAHDPTAHLFDGYINHPDHRACGVVTLDAIFPAAGNPRAFRDLLAEGLTAHKVAAVYLFYTAHANAWIEISGEPLDRKIAGLSRHQSQVDPEWDMPKYMREEAMRTGAEAGVEAAEGFRRITLQD
jgi:LmbE family N-acetylglucosaminyl deacetylase